MEELKFAIELVVPIIMIIVFGYFLKQINLIDDNFLTTGNRLVFKALLPILLFYNTYRSDLSDLESPLFFVYIIVVLLGLMLIGVVVFSRLVKDKKKIGVLVQFLFRINYSVVGYPIIIGLVEGSSSIVAVSTILIVSFNNILSVIVLSYYGEGDNDFKTVVKGIITNPLIIALILGLIFSLLKVNLWTVVDNTLLSLKAIASPFALLVLGGSFSFKSAKENANIISISMILKFVIMPIIGLGISILLGFRNTELAILMVLFSAPVAVSSFVMAEGFKNDGELAGQLVVFSTLITGFSLVLFITILKSLALI